MIKALIALAAISTLGIPQVKAADFTEADLLNVHRELGGRVYVDSDLCKETGAMGLQQGITIHVCGKAHGDNVGELKDTIRHEMWHMVQACNGGPLTDNTIASIGEAYQMGWTGEGYEEDHWHLESEAHYAAATLNAEQVATALINSCTSE